MRKIIALLLTCTLVISGCSPAKNNDSSEAKSDEATVAEEPVDSEEEQEQSIEQEQSTEQAQSESEIEEKDTVTENTEPSESSSDPVSDLVWVDDSASRIATAESFSSLNDPELLRYVEDTVYSDLVKDLDNSDYFVENVSAIYISKEYLEELEYNSKENIFFGYTLSELEDQFQGTKYVFTLGENGETTVVPFEEYEYNYDQVIKNVAIGSGVILLCVTVSVATAGTAPAVSMIFAASAKTGAIFALSSGTFSGVSAAAVTGIRTGDLDDALKAGARAGSEGFKWGAISGSILGGGSTAVALHGATLNGLTMNEAALIQKQSGYPLDVIKEFHSMDEYNAFKEANLTSKLVGNKSALIKTDIDLTKVDNVGRTNLERMKQGLAPQDSNGISYELHHIGQRKDGTLAILTQAEHDNPIIHGFLKVSEAHGPGTNWDAERQAFWKAFALLVESL